MRVQNAGLGASVLAMLVVAACNDEYPLAPTPCDDYCLATQRADCVEDWPDECVRTCEFTRSPTSYPGCTDEFDTLLHCYQSLDDRDFTCQSDQSTPLRGRCADEERALGFCTAPILERCIELCETRSDRCSTIDPNTCFRGCFSPSDECESERISYLDCELADETACDPSPSCTELQVELSDCLNP